MAKPNLRNTRRHAVARTGQSRLAALTPRVLARGMLAHRMLPGVARRTGCALLAGSALALPTAAFADCVATGATVNCSGSSATYSNSASGVTVNVASSAAVTAPLVIGASGTLNNAGTVTGSGAYASVQYGNNATINNATTGTISTSGASSGSAAISVGDNSTVTNDGTLTATTGYAAVVFGTHGTFINNADAPAAVTGVIEYAQNPVGVASSFVNLNTAYGLTGSVSVSGGINAGGSFTATNEGIWTGNLTESANGSTVTFNNGTPYNGTGNPATATATGASFVGILQTGDATSVTNAGTMNLYTTSAVGQLGTGGSTFNNTGVLTLGTTTSPAQVIVSGNFASSGTLNISVSPSGSATPAAGTSYSQLYAKAATYTGTSGGGNATLSGTIGLVVQPGFYATGSKYDVVLADTSLTASNLAITGNNLTFVTFCAANAYTATSATTGSCASSTSSNGVVTTGTQKAFEFIALHTTDYVKSLASAGIATSANRADTNVRAVAGGLDALVANANTTPSGAEGVFLGYIDVLSNASSTDPTQVQDAFASISPEGYYAYVTALHDQARAFSRAIDQRIEDQNSNHDEDGWWLTGRTQFQINSTGDSFRTKSTLYGFSGGYDFSGPHHVLGVAGSVSWDSLKYGLGTMKGTNRDFALGAYGGLNFGPIHLTGSAAYNFGHLSASKTMELASYTFTNTARASEHLIDLNAKAGFQLRTHGLLWEPFAGIDYMNGKVKGFTEGSSLLASALTVVPISANRTDLVAGASLTRDHGVFRPYARVTYRDRIGGNNNNLVSAYFDGNSAGTFSVSAIGEGRHEIDTDAGVNWVFDDAGALFVGYQGTIRNKFQSHGINFGIRIEF